MLLEVFKTDFIDIVSVSILSLKSGQQLISSCWMVLSISTNSYTPGGSSIPMESLTDPSSIKNNNICFI